MRSAKKWHVFFTFARSKSGVFARRVACQEGIKTAAHHCVPNRLYIHARGAGAVPMPEAADVLNVLGILGVEEERNGGVQSEAGSGPLMRYPVEHKT